MLYFVWVLKALSLPTSITLHLFIRQTVLFQLRLAEFVLILKTMSGQKVLLVEDDATLSRVIQYNLVKNGYSVVTAADGAEGLEMARSHSPDIVILDVMLPGMDGLEICRILRAETTIPVIMLTARGEEMDKVVGLELGADDYITKPFGMHEFLARIKVALRRRQPAGQAETSARLPRSRNIRYAGFEIDTDRHRTTLDGRLIELTPKEFDLLSLLVSNPGRVFSRDHLLQKVWGYDYAGDTRTVDVHIRWLREKVETDPAKPSLILTVRGVGYKLEV